jgi:predicted nucleotidyltransferase
MKSKTRARKGRVAPATLADIVKRVVRAARPEKIVLFGSAARGTMGPNSDVDLLVIKGGKFNYWRLLDTIGEHLRGIDVPVDVVVATPEQVERYRHSHCLVFCPALREGKVIYGA